MFCKADVGFIALYQVQKKVFALEQFFHIFEGRLDGSHDP